MSAESASRVNHIPVLVFQNNALWRVQCALFDGPQTAPQPALSATIFRAPRPPVAAFGMLRLAPALPQAPWPRPVCFSSLLSAPVQPHTPPTEPATDQHSASDFRFSEKEAHKTPQPTQAHMRKAKGTSAPPPLTLSTRPCCCRALQRGGPHAEPLCSAQVLASVLRRPAPWPAPLQPVAGLLLQWLSALKRVVAILSAEISSFGLPSHAEALVLESGFLPQALQPPFWLSQIEYEPDGGQRRVQSDILIPSGGDEHIFKC